MSWVKDFALASSAVRLDLLNIPVQERDEVRQHEEFRKFELQFDRPANAALGIRQAIQVKLAERLVGMSGRFVGVESDGLDGRVDRQLEIAGAPGSEAAQHSARTPVARIGLRPGRQRLLLPFQIARDLPVVQRFNPEALDIAGPIAQLIRLERALPRQRPLCRQRCN